MIFNNDSYILSEWQDKNIPPEKFNTFIEAYINKFAKIS